MSSPAPLCPDPTNEDHQPFDLEAKYTRLVAPSSAPIRGWEFTGLVFLTRRPALQATALNRCSPSHRKTADVAPTGAPVSILGAVEFDLDAAPIDKSFAVFAEQDSGCLSYGVEQSGQRWFVKRGTTPKSRQSLARAVAFHATVRHDAIVAPHTVIGGPDDPVLVYPWHDGVVLNHATVRGADRAGLMRFQSLPLQRVVAALTDILDAHVAVAAAGMVAVDLYDGCFLYDFADHRMRLIDLDEYRPGPFTVEEDRLPGSSRYMAPEEFVQGEVIDERSTVFTLGRTIWNLLDARTGWRGTPRHASVVATATNRDRKRRFANVAQLADAWRHASVESTPSHMPIDPRCGRTEGLALGRDRA